MWSIKTFENAPSYIQDDYDDSSNVLVFHIHEESGYYFEQTIDNEYIVNVLHEEFRTNCLRCAKLELAQLTVDFRGI